VRRTGETVRSVASVEHFSEPFPWRTATLVASAIAAVELVGLVAGGAYVLGNPFVHTHPAQTSTVAATTPAVTTVAHRATTPVARHAAAPIPAKDRFTVVSHPIRPRAEVRVLVLNGNGVTGAAHAEASRLQSLGYRIGGAANAPAHRYSQSMVMYVPGYAKEARRLARDTGIRLVAPVDGLTPSTLSASKLVVLLGS
jgi:LytR cell envelope-related transcriptional attenuator